MHLMTPYAPIQWARAFGLVSAGGFIICVLWGFLLADPAVHQLHIDMLRMATLDIGGADFTIVSVIAGTIVSGIWGAGIGAALAMCLNHCHK